MPSQSTRVIVSITMFVILAFGARVHAETTTADNTAAAAMHHDRGVQLFEAGDFNAAITEFQRAQELSPSRTNLWNLARCHEQIGRTYDALAQLDRYLRDPELPPDRRQRALQYRAELQSALGSSSSDTEETTDTPEAPTEAPVEQPASEPEEPTEAPVAVTSSDGPSLAGPWGLLGAGLAVLVTGVILDVVAFARSGDADTSTQAAYDDWREGTRNIAIAGDVMVGVGAATAVGGLIWLLLARRSRSSAQAQRLTVTPVANNGFGLLGRMTF